jgi:alpha-beta hydrolase superfamily lysophospholipase
VSAAVIKTFRASDGYEWQYRSYEPDQAPIGHMIILHGIQSHGGWYETTNQWLVRHGWRVSFLDRRGCGLNSQARGDCPSLRRLLDDIAEFMRAEHNRTAGPVLLMGISWGGKLAVALQKRHPGLCHGLVLITPGFKPKVRPRLWQRLRIAVNRFVRPTRLFPIPLNAPELFTANTERRRFIAEDQWALRQATARLLFESARMDVYLRVAARKVRCPTLVLLAEYDRIINNRKTRRFLGRCKRADVQVIEYSGAHHTLEFESAGPPFHDDLARWLSRLQSPAR